MTDKSDWSDDPDAKKWLDHAQKTLPPMMRDSAICMSLTPANGVPDAKYAVELGMMIMMDKPIIVLVQPGTKVPEKLMRVADGVVEVDLAKKPEESQQRINAAIDDIMRRLGLHEEL
ncbi:MAG TPA: hypothetical protein VK735_39740 [Pseudonocardia sp.]|uniref:hypothetical protein n=1 Tax=Pseudonocardia sp. TaxID=60912 RepID=UPI002D058C87|nr:hypothetical protein [Pseudonocardia sp.]HTF53616.1 hypothetical protein [Pseudonocardia sp.]